jgi:hypothetical protein
MSSIDSKLEAHKRYLEALVEACGANPAAHSHQLQALERELALAALARDAVSYRASSGNLFELSRAAWLDRLANQAQAAATVDDRWSAAAAAVEYRETVRAAGLEDWVSRLAARPSQAGSLLDQSVETSLSFVRLLLCLLRTRCGDRTPEVQDEVLGNYRSLLEADPDFTSESVIARPFYRWRVPWSGDGLATLRQWIDNLSCPSPVPDSVNERIDPWDLIAAGRAAWRKDLKRGSDGVLSTKEPAVEEVIAPYGDFMDLTLLKAESPHEALEWITRKRLPAKLAAAPFRALAEQGLARQCAWPDPLLEHHWRALLHELDGARTVTEVEFAVAREEAFFGVEAGWNVVFLSSLLCPMREAWRFSWEPGDAASRAVHEAAHTSYALWGQGPRALLDVPRVSAFLTECIVRYAGEEPSEIGAFWGEGGFDVLEQARGWVAIERAFGNEVLRDARVSLLALYDGAGLGEPPANSHPVRLWGEELPLADLREALARPGRPAVILSAQEAHGNGIE